MLDMKNKSDRDFFIKNKIRDYKRVMNNNKDEQIKDYYQQREEEKEYYRNKAAAEEAAAREAARQTEIKLPLLLEKALAEILQKLK